MSLRSTQLRRRQNQFLGVIYALIAALIFSTLGALIKNATMILSPFLVLFFRQSISLIILLPYISWAVWRRGKAVLSTVRLKTLLVRTCISVSAAYCMVLALSLIPLSDAVTLSYTRPLFLPFIIWIWLGKRIEGPLWLGLVMGFFGVALILKPSTFSLELGTLLGLLGGILGAVAVLLIRRATKTEPPLRILAYYFLFSSLITAVPVPFVWTSFPTGALLWSLVAIGVLGVLDQLFLTLAYRNGRATVISVVLYATVLFAFGWDILLWGTSLDWWSVAGVLLICLGAILSLVFSHSRAAPGEQPIVAESEKK